MLRGDCPASICVGFELGKVVTQQQEIWWIPLRVLRSGMVMEGSLGGGGACVMAR